MGFGDFFRSIKASAKRPTDESVADVTIAPIVDTAIPVIEAGADLRDAQIECIAQSGMFDLDSYVDQFGQPMLLMEAVRHFLDEGEDSGLSPNIDFDRDFYLSQNTDLADVPSPFLHYINHGRHEGRAAHPYPGVLGALRESLDARRESVVVVLHETSRSGAPILGWNIALRLKRDHGYNVIVVSCRGGGALEAIVRKDADVFIAPTSNEPMPVDQIAWVSEQLARIIRPKYAIVNCAESHLLGSALAGQGVPVVALVHEFATYFEPVEAFERFYSLADTVVFSADLVRRSSAERFPLLDARERVVILHQGRCAVPKAKNALHHVAPGLTTPGDLMRWRAKRSDFNVIGLGAVGWRKGVDLFVGAAAIMKARHPGAHAQFVWVGGQLPNAAEITGYLKEQIKRSGVKDTVVFLPETAELDGVYANADVLFLSSRLDPLPNVAIEAMILGIPVICFDAASGIAEIQKQEDELSFLAVPYMDAAAAAGVLAQLASSAELMKATKLATQKVAEAKFDMEAYVERLDSLGVAAASRSTSSVNSHATIPV